MLTKGQVTQSMEPASEASRVVLIGGASEDELPLGEVLADDQIRIYTVFDQDQVSYAVARLNGELILWPVQRIRVE